MLLPYDMWLLCQGSLLCLKFLFFVQNVCFYIIIQPWFPLLFSANKYKAEEKMAENTAEPLTGSRI